MTKLLPAAAEDSFAVSTCVSFMTLFGFAQQALKVRMQDDAELGLGPLRLRAPSACV